MKKKDYKKKRKNFISKSKIVKKQDFNSSNERRNVKNDLKKEYRSLKRSEKQQINKEIDEKLNNDGEDI